MKLNKLTNIYCYIICLLIAGLASFSLFTNNGFSFHDEIQIANLFEYDKVISLGQFPPRWAPDQHFTYGSPYPEFNYQIPYYIGVFFHKLGFSLIDSYKLVLGLSFVVGAFGMFYLGRLLVGPLAGLVAAFLFTFTPYRAVDVYARGTIGESLAIGIFPWIVLTLLNLRHKQSFENIFLSALSISALILTHQPATAFGLPIILMIFILSEIILKNYKFLRGLLLSLITTFGLSSFYLIPVLFEQKFIKPVSPFNFYDHFPFIKQLIFSPWGYGVSIEGPYDGMSFQIGLANLLVVLLGIIFLIYLISKKKIVKNIYILSVLIGVFVTLFLMNIRSSFLWEIFPYTSSIQFPWRLLSVMSLLTSVLFLFLLSSVKDIFKTLLLITIPLIVLFNNYSYFHPGTIVDHTDNYYLRRYLPNQVLLDGEKVSRDYLDYAEESQPLPILATRPTTFPDAMITSLEPETIITIDGTNPFSMKGNIYSLSGDFVTVNHFFYPGWVVNVDGQIQKISLNKYGAMMFFIPKGNHTFNISFKDTNIRYLANVISLITIGVSMIILKYKSKRKRVIPK